LHQFGKHCCGGEQRQRFAAGGKLLPLRFGNWIDKTMGDFLSFLFQTVASKKYLINKP
jgi:hypothetical protein